MSSASTPGPARGFPAPAGTSGLRRFTIELPADRDLEAVLARLQAGGVAVEPAAAGHEVRDPSRNLARLISRGDRALRAPGGRETWRRVAELSFAESGDPAAGVSGRPLTRRTAHAARAAPQGVRRALPPSVE